MFALQGMGLDFKGKDEGTADPMLVTIVAYIIFDTRRAHAQIQSMISI